MGWYAFMLAGSNYFAPVICGFINDGLGYEWPFYIMGIFCAASVVFLFLFMEETNYARESSVGVVRDEFVDTTLSPIAGKEAKVALADNGMSASATNGSGVSAYPPVKTFLQKMALLNTGSGQPFLMPWRAWQSIKFLSWPTIVYAGFAYGTYLIWFNILNATASIILGGAPYNFKPSIVGLSYLACIVGVIIG